MSEIFGGTPYLVVKEECVLTDEAIADLYAEHEVKNDLVLGPERLQLPDVAYPIHHKPGSQIKVENADEEEKHKRNDEIKQEKHEDEHEHNVQCEDAMSLDPRCLEQLLTTCLVRLDRLPDMKKHYYMNVNSTLYPREIFHEAPTPTTPIKKLNKQEPTTKIESCSSMDEDIKAEYSCKLCGKQFKNGIKLSTHKRTHTKTSNSVVETYRNDVEIKTKYKYKCETCDEKFTAKIKLKSHVRKHGEVNKKTKKRKRVVKEKKYSCDTCGKWFSEKIKLTAHIRVHMGLKPYGCSTCNGQFPNVFKLEIHERIHTGFRPYTCDICGKGFISKFSISEHIMRHIGLKPHACKICQKTFIRKLSLTQHELIHTGLKSFTCDICKKQFSRRSSLNLHKHTHTSARRCICEICGSVMSSKRALDKHQLIHMAIKQHPCNFCKKRFRTRYSMRHHMRVHIKESLNQSDSQISYITKLQQTSKNERTEYGIGEKLSEKCSDYVEKASTPVVENNLVIFNEAEKQVKLQDSVSQNRDTEHMCETANNNETAVICRDGTTGSSASQSSFGISNVDSDRILVFEVPGPSTNHQEASDVKSGIESNIHDSVKAGKANIKIEFSIELKEAEGKNKPFTCATCGKRYAEKNQLIPHFRVHTGTFCCDVCRKTFPYACHLAKHKRKHAEKPMRFTCDVCNMKFKTSVCLKAHSRVHTGEKLHPCKLCNKQFDFSERLKVHLRTHTGEKPFSCDMCQKQFRQRGNLARHKRTHSSDNKPFSCHICNKRFVTHAYARIHQKTHTGEKPYRCNICNKQFLHKTSYDGHTKLHEGPREKTFSCKICPAKFATSSHLGRHGQIHAGVKPFSCDLCEKSFYSKEHLNRHLKNQKRPCVD